MYIRIFKNILDSSIWFERPCVFKLWATLLLKADTNGLIWAIDRALHKDSLLSAEDFAYAIRVLSTPDSDSGNDDDGGVRITRISGSRGWKITSWDKYKGIKNKKEEATQRAAYMRDYMRKKRKKEKEEKEEKDTENVNTVNSVNVNVKPVSSVSSVSTLNKELDVNLDVNKKESEVNFFSWGEIIWNDLPDRIGYCQTSGLSIQEWERVRGKLKTVPLSDIIEFFDGYIIAYSGIKDAHALDRIEMETICFWICYIGMDILKKIPPAIAGDEWMVSKGYSSLRLTPWTRTSDMERFINKVRADSKENDWAEKVYGEGSR